MKMTTQTPEEQITLSSSEFDQFKEEVGPTAVTGELQQDLRLKEQLKLFRIFDKKYLNVNEKKSDTTTSFFIKLAALDSNPVRKRSIKFIPLLLGLLLISLAGFIYYLKLLGLPILHNPYVYTVIVGFVATGSILIVYVIKESRNVLIFYSQHGRIPLAELFYRIPDKSSFNQFVSELMDCINTMKSKSHYTKTQTLAAELSEHRRLRDEGALSSKEYEIAKNNIMAFH
jgi:hypothetical protein